LPWLAELQPELFIELGHDLAKEKGIKNLDWVVVSSPRGHIRAKALVTHRIGVMHIAGKPIHHVGMPWHWGWMGLSTGDVVNDLTSWVGDPNVRSEEHTSELQSHLNLVCRLLLEKKKLNRCASTQSSRKRTTCSMP